MMMNGIAAASRRDEAGGRSQVIGIVVDGHRPIAENDAVHLFVAQMEEQIRRSGGIPLRISAAVGMKPGSLPSQDKRYALPGREAVADAIEMAAAVNRTDGLILVGADATFLSGGLMALGRINVPACFAGFEAMLAACGREQLDAAHTMGLVIEALGLTMPMEDQAAEGLKKAPRPRSILTRDAFENAVTVLMALGGSTDAVLHLLAAAHAANVALDLEDLEEIRFRVPLIGDLQPHGRCTIKEFKEAGGVPAVMKLLYESGLLNGDAVTVAGETVSAAWRKRVSPAGEQEVIRPLHRPLRETGSLAVFRGNLAPEGAVADLSGWRQERLTGTAKVFDTEKAAVEAVRQDEIAPGDIVVIRGVGPKGGPGMPELSSLAAAVADKQLAGRIGLLTDGRYFGAPGELAVGHISPEAQAGGPIALIQPGDRVTIDGIMQEIVLHADEQELQKRREAWKAPPAKVRRGMLMKYARLVSSASKGAVTD
jgi:dihydroxy-acid dehydratase